MNSQRVLCLGSSASETKHLRANTRQLGRLAKVRKWKFQENSSFIWKYWKQTVPVYIKMQAFFFVRFNSLGLYSNGNRLQTDSVPWNLYTPKRSRRQLKKDDLRIRLLPGVGEVDINCSYLKQYPLTYERHNKSESLAGYNSPESIQMIHKTVCIRHQVCWIVLEH